MGNQMVTKSRPSLAFHPLVSFLACMRLTFETKSEPGLKSEAQARNTSLRARLLPRRCSLRSFRTKASNSRWCFWAALKRIGYCRVGTSVREAMVTFPTGCATRCIAHLKQLQHTVPGLGSVGLFPWRFHATNRRARALSPPGTAVAASPPTVFWLPAGSVPRGLLDPQPPKPRPPQPIP